LSQEWKSIIFLCAGDKNGAASVIQTVVRLVELSINSLYIHTIYLPVGGHCTRAGARAPILKTKVHIDISEFKFQLGPMNDSPCHADQKPRFLLDSARNSEQLGPNSIPHHDSSNPPHDSVPRLNTQGRIQAERPHHQAGASAAYPIEYTRQ